MNDIGRSTRRAFLGMTVAGTAFPQLALGQAASGQTAEGILEGGRLEIGFGDHVFTATLYNNPSSRDLVSMLPLGLTVEDYSNNEKIAYLPRKLTEEGAAPFGSEAIGDVCYFAPWGNLVFFYGNYRYSRGLIRLGRLDKGVEPLLTRGTFPLRIRSLN